MNRLAEAIVGAAESVDLVLGALSTSTSWIWGSHERFWTGIRPSGASSILIPSSGWVKKEGFNYPGTPQPRSNFLSLSPLQFNGSAQLAKKLGTLRPKGRKRGEDDSAANKVYIGSVGQSGQFRSAFEHNRYHDVLQFFCCDRLELSRPDYFFMPPSPPSTTGSSVSVGPLHGPLRKSFRSSSMSGLTRKV
jgi:hypothetical protein